MKKRIIPAVLAAIVVLSAAPSPAYPAETGSIEFKTEDSGTDMAVEEIEETVSEENSDQTEKNETDIDEVSIGLEESGENEADEENPDEPYTASGSPEEE